MDTNARQREAEAIVHANYGQAYGKALEAQAGRNMPEEKMVAAAAMLAERNATANRELTGASRADANTGRQAMAQAYGDQRAQDTTAVMSGRVVDYDLPKGFGGTKDMASLVEKGQRLADNLMQDTYLARGRVQATGYNGNFLRPEPGREVESRNNLAGHLLHVRSAIDADVERNRYDREQGNSLYQRFERSVFDPEAQKAGGSKDYQEFVKAQAPRMQHDLSRDVDARFAEQTKAIERARGKEGAVDRGVQIHQHANGNMDKHLGALASDKRFTAHTDGELGKAAYFRGAHEKASELDSKPANFPAFDTFAANRSNVRDNLPDVEGIEHHKIDRGSQKAHAVDDGMSL